MAQTPAAARWSALIEQHEASGLTIKAFAEQKGVNPSTLAWWRSRLGRVQGGQATGRFVELRVAEQASLERRTDDPTVVLTLDSFAAHVVIDRETDLDLLKQVLRALC